jgi:hypothetical protein
MKTIKRRLCITPNDVELVTGQSYRQSLRLLHEIATALNKAVRFVTIEEFCNHTGLNIEQVEKTIFG